MIRETLPRIRRIHYQRQKRLSSGFRNIFPPYNVIGLSKYARLAEWIMGRPQIQEEAVVQLADPMVGAWGTVAGVTLFVSPEEVLVPAALVATAA